MSYFIYFIAALFLNVLSKSNKLIVGRLCY